jgi:hypothetical protein
MIKPISFEEFVSNKRKRPVEVCFKCGKQKEIYTHLNGKEDKPLCNACNMKLRRESPGPTQVKLVKLCATAMGSVESMLALPVEEKQKKALQNMQEELKLMVRVWLGDEQADEEANDTTSTQPSNDEFAGERKAAVSEQTDNLFEAPQSAPASGKSRKALIAARVKARKTAKPDAGVAIAEPNDPLSDPAYQEYLEAPLA